MTRDKVFTVIVSLVSVIVGALIAAGWDIWKEGRRHAEERQKAMVLLRGEVLTNVALLELHRDYLQRDIELAKEKKELVQPLSLLEIAAWDSIRSSGALTERSEVMKELEQTYVSVRILNQRIQGRELYRAVSQAMLNYNERRVLIDQDLLRSVEKLLERLRKHREQLGRA